MSIYPHTPKPRALEEQHLPQGQRTRDQQHPENIHGAPPLFDGLSGNGHGGEHLAYRLGGAAALIVYGVLSILVPSVPAQISGSSMIRIDGSGIFLLLCVAAIAAGAALLLKSTKHK